MTFLLFLLVVVLVMGISTGLFYSALRKPKRLKMPYTPAELDRVERELGIFQPEKLLIPRSEYKFTCSTCYRHWTADDPEAATFSSLGHSCQSVHRIATERIRK